MSFYISRGERVKGPYDEKKLRALFADGILKNSDKVATSPDGPWKSYASWYKTVSMAFPKPAKTPKVPSIRVWKIKRTLLK